MMFDDEWELRRRIRRIKRGMRWPSLERDHDDVAELLNDIERGKFGREPIINTELPQLPVLPIMEAEPTPELPILPTLPNIMEPEAEPKPKRPRWFL